mmetsp:Transcript_24781/g.37002  ORF Transcript_24781/g.37002 Transcript_24781/m.37002 type:complete len:487 (-) Transcript_24781:5652-7112(-)
MVRLILFHLIVGMSLLQSCRARTGNVHVRKNYDRYGQTHRQRHQGQNVVAYTIHSKGSEEGRRIQRSFQPGGFTPSSAIHTNNRDDTDISMISQSLTSSKNIAIVGGGLAGLSTAWFLLTKSVKYNMDQPRITIIDKALPGQGGASSVAGGLLHPFSPRGKMIHLGSTGLHISNELVEKARLHNPECVLRNQLYRVALTDKNVKDLQETALSHPEYATWLSSREIEEQCGSSTNCLGGVVLSSGCKVIHVPSYLQGLWKACEDLSKHDATWALIDADTDNSCCATKKSYWKDRLDEYDTVVLAAGSGLFKDSILQKDAVDFPVELVRGQSVEMLLDDPNMAESDFTNEAILCGKYLAPLPQNRVLVGATHEYKEEPLGRDDVLKELHKRSFDLSHDVWHHGQVDRITTGYRVQSRRGPRGRMPIIGKSLYDDVHRNSWLFSGLSARGLIYHGIFGQTLSEAILKDDEGEILRQIPEAFWWKTTSNS